MVAAHDYASIDDILKKAADAGEAPLIVICDELSDPHNLGAIIRTGGVRRRARGHYSEAQKRGSDRCGRQGIGGRS